MAAALDDLGAEAPFCLWVRGAADLGGSLGAVGRASSGRARPPPTASGSRSTWRTGSAAAGVCVVSGGAYGIDAAAHRGAVAPGRPTLVLLAGGVDRAYPAGNARLLEAVVGAGGALASEVPPGQPADQEPVPAAQPADRRGGQGDGRRRGGVAVRGA